MNDTPRIAQVILEIYSQRFMLSPKELATISRLEQYSTPVEKLLSWIEELASQSKKPSLGHLVHQLEQRAQRWQAQHIGEQYSAESIVRSEQIQEAFSQLIHLVASRAFEQSNSEVLKLFQWLEERLYEYALACRDYPELDPIERLRHLNEIFSDKVFAEAPADILERVQTRTQELLRSEFLRARPQDFVIAQRKVMWSLLRGELHLPRLYLCIYGEW